jgi:hypothetical protein
MISYKDGDKPSVSDIIDSKGQEHFDRCAEEKRDGEVKPITNFNNLGLAIEKLLKAGEEAMNKPKPKK